MKASFKAMLRSPALMLALLFLVMLASSAALATTLSLNSNDVKVIGGTPLVAVNCPASSCQVTSVTWNLDTSAPFYVVSARVAWTPSFTGSAQVCVNVYTGTGPSPTLKAASNCATATSLTANNPTTTTVTFSSAVNPKEIDQVEVIIVQT